MKFEIVSESDAENILKKKPMEFQIKGANRICEIFKEHSRAFLADEPGLGKTYTATSVVCSLAQEFWKDNPDRPFYAIYVAPNQALLAKNGMDILDEAKSLLKSDESIRLLLEEKTSKERLLEAYIEWYRIQIQEKKHEHLPKDGAKLRDEMCQPDKMKEILSSMAEIRDKVGEFVEEFERQKEGNVNTRLKRAYNEKISRTQAKWNHFKNYYCTEYYRVEQTKEIENLREAAKNIEDSLNQVELSAISSYAGRKKFVRNKKGTYGKYSPDWNEIKELYNKTISYGSLVDAAPLISQAENEKKEEIILITISAELMLRETTSEKEKAILAGVGKEKKEFLLALMKKYQPGIIIWDEYHKYLTKFQPDTVYFEWEKDPDKCSNRKLKQLFISATPYRTNISGKNKEVIEDLYKRSVLNGDLDDVEEMMSLPSFEEDFVPLFCGGNPQLAEEDLKRYYEEFDCSVSPGSKASFEAFLKQRMVRHERTRLQKKLEKHSRLYGPIDLEALEKDSQEELKEVMTNTFLQSRRLMDAGYPVGARIWSLSLPWILDFSTDRGKSTKSVKKNGKVICQDTYFEALKPDGKELRQELFVYDDDGHIKDMICSLPRQNLAFYQLYKKNVNVDMRMLLWIPPTFPIYKVSDESIFSKCKDYSKLLVFSEYRYLQRGGARLVSDHVTYCNIHGDFMNGDAENHESEQIPKLFPPELGFADRVSEFECVNIFKSIESIMKKDSEVILDGLITKVQEEYDINNETDVLAAIASPALCAARLGLDACSVEASFHSYFSKNGVKEALWKWLKENHYEAPEDWKKGILRYCAEGNLYAVLEEWLAIMKTENGKSATEQICDILERDGSCVHIQTMLTSQIKDNGIAGTCSFAEQLTGDVSDVGSGQNEEITTLCGKAFSSPFWPMILFAGRGAQEGMDFHQYCSRIMHLTLPRGAVSFEQRNGRIDRFNSLLIRRRIAEYISKMEKDGICYGSEGVKSLFRRILATVQEKKGKEHSELYPNWFFPIDDSEYHFEQLIPMWKYTTESVFMQACDEMLESYRGSMGTNSKEIGKSIDLSTNDNT